MGASIHMHIEVKSGDTWHHYAAPSMFRNAVFFDLVAGIYDKLQPVAPLRGLPENLSFVTQHDWKQDSENFRPHHVGWLKAKELIELQGTGEGRGFTVSEQRALVDLCQGGIQELIAKQKEILGGNT